jgi:oligopeptide/dipeptide ABC transporter ATP-binding protein
MRYATRSSPVCDELSGVDQFMSQTATTPGVTPLLEISDLRTYVRQRDGDVRAVDGVTLSIGHGQTVGLVGESGCGKSMTAMSVLKLLPPGGRIVSGVVQFDGVDLVGLREPQMRRIRGNDIAMVFQDPLSALNPTMTIGRQIAEVLRIHRGWDRARSLARAKQVLELVEMPAAQERIGQYPNQLSGGLRQRSLIAMALACEPKLLIADEPTTALDVTIQAQIFELLDKLKRELDMAVLLITHDLGVIAQHADRVCVMYAGKIVEDATVVELFASPRHRYTEALLEAIPRTQRSDRQVLTGITGAPPDLVEPPPGCRFHERCRHTVELCGSVEPLLTEAGERWYACHNPAEVETG